jgi:hypothetical protein
MKVSGSRSPTPDIPIIEIEDEAVEASPVAPSQRRVVDRPEDSYSNQEINLEKELTSYCHMLGL